MRKRNCKIEIYNKQSKGQLMLRLKIKENDLLCILLVLNITEDDRLNMQYHGSNLKTFVV